MLLVVLTSSLLVVLTSSWCGTGAGAAELPVAAAPEVPVGSGTWPLRPTPEVVTGFDPPATTWSPGHRGADLAGRPAQSVHAALAGTVRFAGRIAGRGVVVVDHGGLRTTYEPVSASVGIGDLVSAGATIGELELFGSHCFPAWCLHWGLIEGSDHYLDPLALVGAAPVILLPLDPGPTMGAFGAGEPITAAPVGPSLRAFVPAFPSAAPATGSAAGALGRAGLGPATPPPGLGPAPGPARAQARGWAW